MHSFEISYLRSSLALFLFDTHTFTHTLMDKCICTHHTNTHTTTVCAHHSHKHTLTQMHAHTTPTHTHKCSNNCMRTPHKHTLSQTHSHTNTHSHNTSTHFLTRDEFHRYPHWTRAGQAYLQIDDRMKIKRKRISLRTIFPPRRENDS